MDVSMFAGFTFGMLFGFAVGMGVLYEYARRHPFPGITIEDGVVCEVGDGTLTFRRK